MAKLICNETGDEILPNHHAVVSYLVLNIVPPNNTVPGIILVQKCNIETKQPVGAPQWVEAATLDCEFV